jgi:hypothetical protein
MACFLQVAIRFEPYQQLARILLRKARDQAFAMLVRSFDEIAGYAGIDRSILSACHHVDKTGLHPLAFSASGSWAPAFVVPAK